MIIVLDRNRVVGVLLITRGGVCSGRLLVGNGLFFDNSGHSDWAQVRRYVEESDGDEVRFRPSDDYELMRVI